MLLETAETLLTMAALIWGVIILLPWHPWRTTESLDAVRDSDGLDLSDVTVVVPARNEASVIQSTLASLDIQGNGLQVILVNDASEDNTRSRALDAHLDNLRIIDAQPLPAGWSGKLWAQHQGVSQVETPYTLLMDADIRLEAGTLSELRKQIDRKDADFVSLMAMPPLFSRWEALLMPAFVYFFKMLYPFHLSNKPASFVAAAAGGCILVKTPVFEKIGGLSCIRDALIDDCTLAKQVKRAGFVTWTGLTHSVHSQRPYTGLEEIWNMVARTAFTQLFYSYSLLAVCVFLMLLLFALPMVGLLCPHLAGMSGLTLLLMMATYLPMIRYYRLNPLWVLTLPCAAMLYLAMTLTSAWRYSRGERSRWKGRSYHTAPDSSEV